MANLDSRSMSASVMPGIRDDKNFNGLVVDGPLAGQFLSSDAPTFYVVMTPSLPIISDREVDFNVSMRGMNFTYKHIRLHGTPIQFWAPMDWSIHDVLLAITNAYIDAHKDSAKQ